MGTGVTCPQIRSAPNYRNSPWSPPVPRRLALSTGNPPVITATRPWACRIRLNLSGFQMLFRVGTRGLLRRLRSPEAIRVSKVVPRWGQCAPSGCVAAVTTPLPTYPLTDLPTYPLTHLHHYLFLRTDPDCPVIVAGRSMPGRCCFSCWRCCRHRVHRR